MSDKIRLVVAFLLVAGGVAGYYLLSDQAAAFRVIAVLAGVLSGALVAGFTTPGGHFVAFSRESWAETKRVVWPTRQETIRTTGIVFLMVVVIALFLWVVDASLMSLVKMMMGQGD